MFIRDIPGGLTTKSPAKLNLYLEVSEPRPDDFHDIDSLFQTIDLFDEIDFVSKEAPGVELVEEGMSDGDDNLVSRAARRLAKEHGVNDGVRITLRKTIPSGAGLGGGSGDAAVTLLALAKLWKLKTTREALARIGADLGSDVPFFLYGGTARCEGRGEVVTPLDSFDENPMHYVLVAPGIHTSTPKVYRALDESRPEGFTLTVSSPIDSVDSAALRHRLDQGEVFFNRLEAATLTLHPELSSVATRMREEPFVSVRMTGSGSAFFGVCSSRSEAEDAAQRLRDTLPALGDAGASSAPQVWPVSSLSRVESPWVE
ncbi:MAG: 4-(cytidine 5'-diphospho)-2-C-methyl-D-erythritol kinase [Planctomycetota bacterium]